MTKSYQSKAQTPVINEWISELAVFLHFHDCEELFRADDGVKRLSNRLLRANPVQLTRLKAGPLIISDKKLIISSATYLPSE